MIITMKKCYRNKILMTIFLVFVLSVSSFAQRNADVMGRVTDSITKSGIPYAAVRLFDSIGNLQNGCITDTFGYFNMKKVPQSIYSLDVSCLGYRTYHKTFDVNKGDVYARIELVMESQMLDNIVVKGERITMREEIDKTIYRIDDFTLRNSTTALEALKTIPGITTRNTDETVRVNGSTNVLVLVDGAFTTRSLTTITPEDIESIEVITNPSVEYDSDVANVINIVLKEERKKGLRLVTMANGTLPDQSDYLKLMADFEFSKFRLFADYSFNRFVIRPETFVYDSSYYSINDADGSHYETYSSVKLLKSPANIEHSIRYGFDYRINKNNYLKFSGSYSLDKSEFLSNLFSQYYADGFLLYDAVENDKSKMTTPEQNYTLYYRHKFSKKGHELSFNSNFYIMKRDNQNTYSSRFIYSDGDVRDVDMLRHLNNNQTVFNAKLKYDLPLSDNFKISVGAQSIYREIHYSYDNSLDNQYFDYTDLRLAGFLQATYNIKENLSVMAGIRCEQLEFDIYDTINSSKLNYLPNLSLLHRINKKHSLRLNYKTLLTYPSYHFLTPFVYNETDSLSYSYGNPELLPAKTQNIGFQYTFRNRYTQVTAEPYISLKKDIIGETRQIDGAVTRTFYDNIAHSTKYGGRFNATTLLLGFLQPMINLDFGYVVFNDRTFNGFEFSLDGGIIMALPWDMELETYITYIGKQRNYNGYYAESPIIEDITISKDFSNNFSVSLSYEEAFLSTKNEEVCIGPNYYQRDWGETKHSAFRLYVRYVFNAGNKTLKDAEELESLMESEKNVKQRK